MYSKCDKKDRPKYITDLENQFSNALDSLQNNGTETGSSNSTTGTSPKDQGSQSGKPFNSTRISPPSKSPKSKEQLALDHFKNSPFSDGSQLNLFLLWFGIISTLLIMAFIIQCCREMARGDDVPPNQSVGDRKSLGDPMAIDGMDS